MMDRTEDRDDSCGYVSQVIRPDLADEVLIERPHTDLKYCSVKMMNFLGQEDGGDEGKI